MRTEYKVSTCVSFLATFGSLENAKYFAKQHSKDSAFGVFISEVTTDTKLVADFYKGKEQS